MLRLIAANITTIVKWCDGLHPRLDANNVKSSKALQANTTSCFAQHNDPKQHASKQSANNVNLRFVAESTHRDNGAKHAFWKTLKMHAHYLPRLFSVMCVFDTHRTHECFVLKTKHEKHTFAHMRAHRQPYRSEMCSGALYSTTCIAAPQPS